VIAEEPSVAIIILNWNGLEDTTECLESLKRISYSNYHVIVVDNGSEGDDVGILRKKFGDFIQIIENGCNYGFAEGNNIGMRHAIQHYNPAYILLLNNDTVVDPDCLAESVKMAESDPQIGIVGPKVLYYNKPDRIQSAGGLINWWTGRTTLLGCNQIESEELNITREVDWVLGCAMLARQETIQKVGLLYSEYFAYVEEVDWCARSQRAGYKVMYTPKAVLFHKRRIKRVDRVRLYYRTRNRFKFMQRNATRIQFASFLAYFFLMEMLRTQITILWWKDLLLLPAFYRGIYDGIRFMLKGADCENW
jgi:GT2 family glycosyltransferase